MGILLTPEEIAQNWIPLNQIVEPKQMVFLEGEAIAKAQARKILNWGHEYCSNPKHAAFSGIPEQYRCLCSMCWAELKKEIE